MDFPSKVLLGFGLFFPAVSLVTLVLAAIESRRTGRNVSAILIPFVGPMTLTCWILITGQSAWLIPMAWVTDPGTILFLWIMPRLIAEAWRISRWTRLKRFEATLRQASATLTLHRHGYYLLKRSWVRTTTDFGPLSSSETGRYQESHDQIVLTSPDGTERRQMHRLVGGTWMMKESGDQGLPDSKPLAETSMDGWDFKERCD